MGRSANRHGNQLAAFTSMAPARELNDQASGCNCICLGTGKQFLYFVASCAGQ